MLQMKMLLGTGWCRIESRTTVRQLQPPGGKQLTVVETSGSTERTVFAQVASVSCGKDYARGSLPDVDVWELALRVFDEPSHGRVLVEPDDDNLGQPLDFGKGREGVPDHGFSSDGQERLGTWRSAHGIPHSRLQLAPSTDVQKH